MVSVTCKTRRPPPLPLLSLPTSFNLFFEKKTFSAASRHARALPTLTATMAAPPTTLPSTLPAPTAAPPALAAPPPTTSTDFTLHTLIESSSVSTLVMLRQACVAWRDKVDESIEESTVLTELIGGGLLRDLAKDLRARVPRFEALRTGRKHMFTDTWLHGSVDPRTECASVAFSRLDELFWFSAFLPAAIKTFAAVIAAPVTATDLTNIAEALLARRGRGRQCIFTLQNGASGERGGAGGRGSAGG